MSRRRFSARSSNHAIRGFTISEVLVGLSLASLVSFGVGTGFVFVSRAWTEAQARLQTQGSLRGIVAAMNRDVRIVGACMPLNSNGSPLGADFTPVAGTNGTNDTVTVSANPLCATANLTATCTGCASLSVDNITNFSSGQWAYISNNGSGQFIAIANATAGTLTVDPSTPLTGNYLATAGGGPSQVNGADLRTYAISSTCSGCGGIPTLTVQLLGGTPQPLVKGIDRMKIQYVLNKKYSDNPAACDGQYQSTPSVLCVVNLPGLGVSAASDWTLVRVMLFTVDARSTLPVRGTGGPDGFLHQGAAFTISPRNLVFPSGRV